MNKFKLLFVLISLPLLAKGQERIMLIADPHVYPLQSIAEREDFDTYMQTQRKMLDLSEPVWNALMDTALVYKPDLVLIPGDLTKDGEPESHALVAASLRSLKEAGIPSLVIPGNHDWPDSNNWDELYSWVYEGAEKDADSHSFVAHPFSGVTVIGIDGSRDNASIGTLSEQSLAWILEQADSAVAHNHMIIAMCHWQILEHIDNQGTLESSCRMADADALRDRLMHHGVHLVLTGHFHVNGITTYRDTTGVTNDSIVEITTGSPITYPCPYRWLTLSQDRKSISVETEYINSLPNIENMHSYSREWMREHATGMIPQMTLRAWRKVDQAIDKLGEKFGQYDETVIKVIKMCLPKTDEEKIDLVQRHLGSTIVDMYLLHSDANEPDYPEGDSLAQALYEGMSSMMHEMTDPLMGVFMRDVQEMLIVMAQAMAQESVQSLVEDKTHWASALYADRTDDLSAVLIINNGYNMTPVDNISAENNDTQMYDLLGRPVVQPARHGIYILNHQKIIR